MGDIFNFPFVLLIKQNKMKKILLFIVAALLICSCKTNFKANQEVVDGEIYEVEDTVQVDTTIVEMADTTVAE